MQAGCLRHSEIPHASQLYLDFLYHFERVQNFYEHHYQTPGVFASAAAQLDYPIERRHALVAALREINRDSPQLEALAAQDTVAVVTGQQVGLFGGPIYTIYKALTAARLAESLRREGIRAVPVFWLATEDHDFHEVDHAWLFDAATQPARIDLIADADHRPAGQVLPGAYPLDPLEKLIGGFPHGAEVIDKVARSYRPGQTMGAAFHALLQEILDGFPFLFIDPMLPALRRLAAPLLRGAASQASQLSEALLARNLELTAAGYHAQVHLEPKSSLFFLLQDGQRVALRRKGGFYESPLGVLNERDLAALGEQLSPNALLRPVMQDYLLPTVAQVAGPAELAYLAQSQVLYRILLGRAPVIVPRSAFTLLEPRAARLIRRYRLTHADFFAGPHAVRERISKQLVPESLRQSIALARRQTAVLLDNLHRDISEFDPALGAAAAKSKAKILYQFAKIEAKTAREALLRDQRASADADYLNGLLFPNKHLQERLYSILPFLARHGLGLIEHIYHNIRLDCPDHVVLPV
jgi:bacillithiol biosynthesis cysteine-adding enzyme BshC